MRIPVLILVAALVGSPAAFAQTNGHGGHQGHDGHAGHGAGPAADSATPVTTEATINAVDGDTVNVTHPPIPAIGWPQMTMDLKLLEGASLGAAQPGDQVTLELEKGADGLYAIKSVGAP